MSFINVSLIKEQININSEFKAMFNTMENEVLSFAQNFHDDPKELSAWGHNYFCKDDGSALIYNPKDSHTHECPLCHKVYSDNLFHQVWVYKYRNEAILTLYKAAILYKVSQDNKYLEILKDISSFYMTQYDEFELHDKGGNTFESIESMGWGCGRIMPQGLNESISMIRFFAGLAVVEEDLSQEFKALVSEFSLKVYSLLKPQVDKIHNISCWLNSAIGVMGLFTKNQEMIDFTFNGELNIRRQLREGVTLDKFWYEGSIHYNFFTLEGVSYLSLFAKHYNYSFGEELQIIEDMFIAAYKYAFSSHRLPNPNDGWPNVNLKTYSYIYCVGTRVFGNNSNVGNILASILNKNGERGCVPLSKPYYYNNQISLERFAFLPEFEYKRVVAPEKSSVNFETSNFALLMKDDLNLFYKYGHNTPSHAHPDKMTIEVMIGDTVITRDLSNAGYGSTICNEWHRMSSSHNTIVVDGQNHSSVEPGELITFKDDIVGATALNVYEGVDFVRQIAMKADGFIDNFSVVSDKEHTYDYFMHIEGKLINKLALETVDLGYYENGYQHIKNVRKLVLNTNRKIEWKVNNYKVIGQILGEDMEVFIADSPDNPISGWRSTLIVRSKAKASQFNLDWTIKKL